MYQQEPRKGRKEEVVLISARLLRYYKKCLHDTRDNKCDAKMGEEDSK